MKPAFPIRLALLLTLSLAAMAQVTLSNVSLSNTSLSCLPTQVATPVISVASGAVSPGSTVTISDSTPGSTIYYTWDGSGVPTYDATTYLGTNTSHIFGTAHQGLANGGTLQTAITVYAPMTLEAIAIAPGMTDSAPATATYTLMAPTGAALSACGALTSASTTYYLTGNVSSTGTCFQAEADNITLNLNGHTITYGTGGAPLLTGTNGVTNGTTTFTGSGFTSAMTGDVIIIDDLNQTGGYQNFVGTMTYVSSTQVTLSGTPSFSLTGLEYKVEVPPSYGVQCNAQITGNNCKNLTVYNGTFSDGSGTASMGSSPIQDGSPAQYGDNGAAIFAGLTFDYAAAQGQAIQINYTAGGDSILFNTMNVGVTTIYSRDQQPTPIKILGTNDGPATTPLETITDNICNTSPLGCVDTNNSATVLNNSDLAGTIQYSNSFGVFCSVANCTGEGNTITGDTQGLELEASNTTYKYNYVNTQSSPTTHDPNHNPDGCNNNFNIRTKNFASTDVPITGNVIENNFFQTTNNACAGETIEYSQLWTGDTATISGNDLSLIMAGPSLGGENQSSIYGFDGGPPPNDGNASDLTFTGNNFSITGAYASQGLQVYVNYDQVNNVTIGGLSSPAIGWVQGGSGINSSLTLTGSGSATCSKTPNSGSTSSLTLTYNGSSVSCP